MKPWAWISGGTSGIGLETAKLLGDDFRLVLTYHNNHERAQLAREILGSEVVVMPLDVSQDQVVQEGAAALQRRMGQAPQVLVNCAGIAKTATYFVQNRNLDDIKRQFDVNFFGTVRLCQAVVKGMYAARQGVIVGLLINVAWYAFGCGEIALLGIDVWITI